MPEAPDTCGTPLATALRSSPRVSRLLFLFALTVSLGAAAQTPPSTTEGRSLMSWRVPFQEYGANAQNWGFAQRSDGRIYAANTEGILEYDGATWRKYTTPDSERLLIRSLAVGRNGRVYAGGIGDVGYLSRDSAGTPSYKSLKGHIAPGDRDFADVWTTHATRHGVVFQSASRLFRWTGRRMEVWRTETRFRSAFLVEGVVYVWEDGVGIKSLGPTDLMLIPEGADFATRKVDSILPGKDALVAIVRDEGLVSLRPDESSSRIPGPASEYLTQHRPYTAIAVPDRYDGRGILYAVGTVGGGIAIVSPDGRLVRVYREDIGLTEGDDVLGLYADDQGGLWVALQNGIVRLDLFARHTWFDSDADGDRVGAGIVGATNTVAEHDGTIYAATDRGLYRQVRGRLGRPGDGPAYSHFEPVPGTAEWGEQILALLDTDHGLLVGTGDGIYAIESGRTHRVWQGENAAFVLFSVSPTVVLAGTKDGLIRLVLREGLWSVDRTIDGIAGETRYIQEDAAGAVWISQPGGKLYRIPDPAAPRVAVESYGASEGLSASTGPLFMTGGRLFLASREGVHEIERTGARIRLTRAPEFASMSGVYGFFTPAGDALWTYADGILRAPEVGFEMAGLQPNSIYTEPSGVVWIASPDGLLRYDPRVRLGERTYPALVRRVTSRQNDVFFGGTFPEARGDADLTMDYDAALGLRFEYSAALFDRPGRVRFSTRMLGSEDETWSPYVNERVATYLGLYEGLYSFEVRARDDLGRESSVGTFRLRILPPWYRTWWAYALYVLAFVGFVWGITAWRLRKQRIRLEAARARNARMQRLGARLQETNTRLRRADKLKDDLLANTSHELRTPLTAVLGFSEMLLDEVEGEQRDLAAGILRGGQRLLATVDGLLDMFKLQSGTLDLYPQEIDAAAAVRASVRALEPLAQARGVGLGAHPADLALPATMDQGVFDRILTHVVGNAVKFTDEGEVTVLVDATDQSIVVTVRDTGVGIPADMVERVFEPFEQASRNGLWAQPRGYGPGLGHRAPPCRSVRRRGVGRERRRRGNDDARLAAALGRRRRARAAHRGHVRQSSVGRRPAADARPGRRRGGPARLGGAPRRRLRGRHERASPPGGAQDGVRRRVRRGGHARGRAQARRARPQRARLRAPARPARRRRADRGRRPEPARLYAPAGPAASVRVRDYAPRGAPDDGRGRGRGLKGMGRAIPATRTAACAPWWRRDAHPIAVPAGRRRAARSGARR